MRQACSAAAALPQPFGAHLHSQREDLPLALNQRLQTL